MKTFGKVEMKSGGSTFIRLKDGDVLVGVFQGDVTTGEPVLRYTHFDQDDKKSHSCTQTADCPLCVKGSRPKVRGMFNVIVYEENKFKAKVFETSATVFNQIAELSEVANLDETVLRVKRTGSKMDTEYSIINLPAPPKEFKNIKGILAEVTLHDLVALSLVGADETAALDNGVPTEEE